MAATAMVPYATPRISDITKAAAPMTGGIISPPVAATARIAAAVILL